MKRRKKCVFLEMCISGRWVPFAATHLEYEMPLSIEIGYLVICIYYITETEYSCKNLFWVYRIPSNGINSKRNYPFFLAIFYFTNSWGPENVLNILLIKAMLRKFKKKRCFFKTHIILGISCLILSCCLNDSMVVNSRPVKIQVFTFLASEYHQPYV